MRYLLTIILCLWSLNVGAELTKKDCIEKAMKCNVDTMGNMSCKEVYDECIERLSVLDEQHDYKWNTGTAHWYDDKGNCLGDNCPKSKSQESDFDNGVVLGCTYAQTVPEECIKRLRASLEKE